MNKVIFFQIIFFVISYSLLACSSDKDSKSNKEITNNTPLIVDKNEKDSTNIPKVVYPWIDKLSKINSGFHIDSFSLYNKNTIDFILTVEYKPIKEVKLYNKLFSFSPDSSKFIDIYSYNTILSLENNKTKVLFDVDSEASLVVLDKKKKYRLLFLGSMGGFDDIFWINNYEFVIVGYHEEINVNTNNSVYCPDIWHYNLNENIVLHYQGTCCKSYIFDYFENKFPDLIIE